MRRVHIIHNKWEKCLLNSLLFILWETSQVARFMGPTWGPPGSCRPQVGPMLAPWTLIRVMAWIGCNQATGHYLNQSWPGSINEVYVGHQYMAQIVHEKFQTKWDLIKYYTFVERLFTKSRSKYIEDTRLPQIWLYDAIIWNILSAFSISYLSSSWTHNQFTRSQVTYTTDKYITCNV